MPKITDIKNEEDYINTKKALKVYRPIAYLCFIVGGFLLGILITLGIIGAGMGVDISSEINIGFLCIGILFVLGFVMLALRSWIETKLEVWEKQHPTMSQQPQYPQPFQAYPSQQQPMQQVTQPTLQTAQLQYCPSCGKQLQSDWQVCGYCGRKLK